MLMAVHHVSLLELAQDREIERIRALPPHVPRRERPHAQRTVPLLARGVAEADQ